MKCKMNKKVMILGLGLIAFVFLIIMFSYSEITGRVIEGDSCERESANTCDGETVLICANGKWIDGGKIPGQCGYQTRQTNTTSTIPDDPAKKDYTIVFIAMAILLLIVIIGGVIIYISMKKKKSSLNNIPKPKNQPPFNSRMTLQPINTRLSTGVRVPVDAKRFTPPKR